MSETSVTPEEALDKLFTVIREEAVANPKFAKRLFDAVGMSVLFQGLQDLDSLPFPDYTDFP